jgi:hypothetical protein
MINKEIFTEELSRKAEQLGCLPTEWLEEIHREKWFQLFVTKALGGLELSLPEGLELEEKLAKVDGSLGWTITLCAGASWFVGFMEKSLRNKVFSDSKVCLAGSGFVGGKANKIGEFYQISGSWTYASGALHASHFTANCEIYENGSVILDDSGKPIVRAFILEKEEVEILDSWNYMGMIATGSHAFKTQNLSVPENRCFDILPEKVALPNPIYRYPFLQFAEATLAVNILGITGHFQELVEAAFGKRKDSKAFAKRELDHFEKSFNKENARLAHLRMEFYKTVKSSWDELEQVGQISTATLKKVSKVSRKLTQACRISNASLYPYAGLEGAKTHTELNRVWRDFNTVSQHSLLTFPF